MVKHITVTNRNMLVVRVRVAGFPEYDVHIQMDDVTVLPQGKTEVSENPHDSSIKKITVSLNPDEETDEEN